MEGTKERFTETEEETVFEIELGDLRHLVAAPDPDPFSERPMEYLGQSAMERIMHMYRPPKSRKERRYRLILRMPSEKVSQDTAAQAKALISKIGARTIEDNKNRIKQIQKRGRRQLPYAMVILFICIGLGIFFGLGIFVEQSPVLALAISEGFYIVGWIALWRPMDVLLFDPMEIKMENKILKALMGMQIEAVPI
jgi:hypothetical protein